MTLKIQAYQALGKKTDHIVDEYEFCCWDALFRWLQSYGQGNLHKCPKCKARKGEAK